MGAGESAKHGESTPRRRPRCMRRPGRADPRRQRLRQRVRVGTLLASRPRVSRVAPVSREIDPQLRRAVQPRPTQVLLGIPHGTRHYTLDRGIATVTLDSPETRNALSAQLVGGAVGAPAAAAATRDVAGSGPHHTGSTFCAAPADLKESSAEVGGAGHPANAGMLPLDGELPKPVIARHRRPRPRRRLGIVGACESRSQVRVVVRVHRGTAGAGAGDHLAHHAGADDRPCGGALLPDRRDIRAAPQRYPG